MNLQFHTMFQTTRLHTTRRVAPLLLLFVLLLGSLAGTTPAQAAPSAQGGIQRIRFAPGATGAVVYGVVGSGQVARYVLTALAGQTMTVQANSEGAPIFVTIFDTNNNVLGSASS